MISGKILNNYRMNYNSYSDNVFHPIHFVVIVSLSMPSSIFFCEFLVYASSYMRVNHSWLFYVEHSFPQLSLHVIYFCFHIIHKF